MFKANTIDFCVIDVDTNGQKVTSRLSNRGNTFVSNPILLEANLDEVKSTIQRNILARARRRKRMNKLYKFPSEGK